MDTFMKWIVTKTYVIVQVVTPYTGKRIQVSDIKDLLSDELISGIWEIIHDLLLLAV